MSLWLLRILLCLVLKFIQHLLSFKKERELKVGFKFNDTLHCCRGLSALFVFSLLFLLQQVFVSLPASAEIILEPVKRISVMGNNRVPDSTILYYIEMREGDNFDEKQVQKDIKKLYGMDLLDDINVTVKHVDGGVEVVYTVREKPSVGSVKISGNRHINTADIAKRVTIKKGMVFKQSLLVANVSQITRYYRGQGYYFVKVIPQYKETVDGKVNVKFRLKEGPKALISEIKFVGNDHVDRSDLLKFMKTKEKFFLLSTIFDWGVLKEGQLRQDMSAVQAVLQDHGYLNAVVYPPEIEADRKNGDIKITIRVKEGELYTIKSVEVKGDDIYTSDELREHIKLKAGEVYSRAKVRNDILAITDLYSRKGYAFADIVPDVKEDKKEKSVAITYSVDHGERAYVGSISISGNETTRDYVVRRELRLKEGGLLDTIALQRSKARLSRLGYFEDVKMNYTKNKDGLMDLDIQVTEKPSGKFSVGIGYSSSESMILTGNVTQKNLFGRGQTLTLSMGLSKLRRDFRLGFHEPWLFNREISIGGEIFNQNTNNVSFQILSSGGSFNIGRAIDEYSSLSLGYKLETIKTSNVDAAVLSNFLFNGTSVSSAVSATYKLDHLDSDIKPTEGLYTTAVATLAGLGGDKYYKAEAKIGYYYPLSKKIVLHGRGVFGYGAGYGGEAMKSYARFLSDEASFRGYKVSDVGPRDTGGSILGGTQKVALSLEAHYVVNAFLRPYAFMDAGNIYGDGPDITSTAKSFSFGKLRYSWGLGTLLNTPMGPLNLSYGFKVNPLPGESPGLFNLGMGRAF